MGAAHKVHVCVSTRRTNTKAAAAGVVGFGAGCGTLAPAAAMLASRQRRTPQGARREQGGWARHRSLVSSRTEEEVDCGWLAPL